MGHDEDEDRWITVGLVARGLLLVVYTIRGAHDDDYRGAHDDDYRIISARTADADERRAYADHCWRHTMTDKTRIDEAFFARAMRDDALSRLRAGTFTGADLASLRRMLKLSQDALASQLSLSVDTIRNWEQDRCQPDGPARTLIRLLATRPGLVLRLLQPAA